MTPSRNLRVFNEQAVCTYTIAVGLTIISLQIGISQAANGPVPVQTIMSGFLPSPVKYFTHDGKETNDLAGVESNVISTTSSLVDKPAEERGQDGRFGYPMTAPGNGYGGVQGVYMPTKIDLGGVLIGAVIGFGAVVILPKLLQILSSPHPHHSGYARSTGLDEMTSSLTNVIDRVDFALHEQNINSTVCLERALCQFLQSSSPGSVVESLTRNPLFTSLIEGSRIKGIVEVSHSPNGCENMITKCPLNQEILTNAFRALVNV